MDFFLFPLLTRDMILAQIMIFAMARVLSSDETYTLSDTTIDIYEPVVHFILTIHAQVRHIGLSLRAGPSWSTSTRRVARYKLKIC